MGKNNSSINRLTLTHTWSDQLRINYEVTIIDRTRTCQTKGKKRYVRNDKKKHTFRETFCGQQLTAWKYKVIQELRSLFSRIKLGRVENARKQLSTELYPKL